jgi:hypothetical protein
VRAALDGGFVTRTDTSTEHPVVRRPRPGVYGAVFIEEDDDDLGIPAWRSAARREDGLGCRGEMGGMSGVQRPCWLRGPLQLTRPGASSSGEDGLAALRAKLADHRRYERQIDRLHQRHLADGGLWSLTEKGVPLAAVTMDRSRVARLLARAVECGEYLVGPARVRTVRVDGKARTLFGYGLFDLIVHGVVAGVLAEAVEPTLSDRLYSYRSGVSWLDAVGAFAAYARAHRRDRPDPRARGLYVLRRDVASYTDSIPVDETSAIWSQVTGALGLEAEITGSENPPWPVVRDVLRATVIEDHGRPRRLDAGVPTGQPIASVAFNLYLRDLDHEMTAVPGAFYARYSDDLLFAHPDPTVARDAAAAIERRVHALRLDLKAEKARDLYLTGAGRASDAWPGARGVQAVGYLGMDVAIDGTVALGGRKLRRLLRDARLRVRNAVRATDGWDEETRGPAVAAALNALLDPHDHALRGAQATLLARAVTSRAQLDWLDRALAGIAATALAGADGPRALRQVPYRSIRTDLGLRSARRARDRGVTPRRAGTGGAG